MVEKEIKDFATNDDLNLFFDNFIKEGVVIKEDEVVQGFRVKLKVLNTGELLSAESVMYSIDNIPLDIVQKVRCASILSQSILAINDIEVEKENMTQEDIRVRRIQLYQRFLDMPAYVVQKTYDLYLSAVKEQIDFYSDSKELSDKIENF